jgi:hypothetical protein
MESLFRKLGVYIPEILLPAKGIDLAKWSVIACDQYTSQPDYWIKVIEEVGDSPSTLRLTFPEIYLKDDDKDTRISDINQAMLQYLDQGILEPQKPGFILVDRSTPHAVSRKGLVLAVDLECYDYREGSQALIRATEGTVLDRIPPRVKIRENAPIELPHIMVLIDDPDKTVIEPLFERKDSFEKLYDFELMQGGGHIRGWKVDDAASLSMAANALAKLAGPLSDEDGPGIIENRSMAQHTARDNRSNTPCNAPLLFAMGDGNHSLASAKTHWENVKASLLQQSTADTLCIPDHSARYALVEVVNVHDDGLVFEPIHRVLFGVNSATVLDNMKNICGRESEAEYRLYDCKSSMEAAVSSMKNNKSIHLLPFILEGNFGLVIARKPSCSLEVGTLQFFIDNLIKGEKGIEVDYIHGDQVVTELGSQKNCMGFYLPVMDKHDLFRTVILDGVLPRKTFSMGEAEEKRYYLECRRIK